MTPMHSLPLVVLSVVIATVAAYSALVLTGRVAAAHGRARRRWLLGGGVAMGGGIWSMHFIAMLAFRFPAPIAHDVPGVILSLAVAVGASVLALYAASRPTLSRLRLAAAGLAMGGGIAGMHYIGMTGLVTAARVQYDPVRVGLSLLVAVGASLTALWLAFHLRDRDAHAAGWRHALGALVMGCAIAGMHYTGMWAARFTPPGSGTPARHEMLLDASALVGAVVVAAGVLLLLAVFAARADRRARSHSAMILERITDGFLAFDLEGCCTYANRAAEQLLRRPRQAMLGSRARAFLPDVAGSVLEGACRRAMAEQSTAHVEELHPSLGLWLEVHVYPSADGLSVYFRDVSARREADQALRRREHQLAEAQRIAHVGSWEWEVRTGDLAWSRELYRIYGLEPGSFAPTFERFLACVHPDDRDNTAARVREALERGEVFDFEERIVRPDGEVRVLHSQGQVIVDAEGAPLRLTGTCQDITERKEAEERLRHANDMVDAVIHASPLAVVAVDTDRRVTLWNPAAERVFGWSRDEVLGRENPTLPPGQTGVLGELRDGAAAGVNLRELRRRRRDGSLVDVSVSAAPLCSPAGEVLGAVAILADITAQRAASDALRASEERFRELAENIREVFWVMSPREGRLLYVSPVVEQVWGVTPAALQGDMWRFMETVHPDDRAQVSRAFAAVQQDSMELEYRIVRPGGEVRWIRDRGFPVRDAAGAVIRVVGAGEDITARREAEEAVRANERQAQKMAERMRAVAGAAAATIGAQSPEALRDVLLEAARRVLPFDTFTFATLAPDGRGLLYLGDYDAGVYEPARLVPLAGTPGQRVIRERRSLLTRRSTDPAAQGALLWGTGRRSESSIRTPIRSGDQVLGLLTAQSYTPELYDEHDVEVFEALAALAATALRNLGLLAEQNAAQEALHRSQEQLAQAQKMEAVGRLAGGVAHDFNNLLTVIAGNADLVLLDHAADAELREQMGEVKGAVDRAASLTRQLLAFSRQQVLQPRLLDLDAVVSGMHRMLSRLIAEDVDVVLKLHGALPSVKADPTQMEQVVLNLAVNARDAMPEGGQMVIRTRTLELDRPQPRAGFEVPAGAYVVLSVTDTGCGMDAETLRRVFEPFFTTKEEGRGTGLGLATVYGIVKQSGGFIDVASEPGRGTAFEIFLPSVAAELPRAAVVEGAPARLATGSGTVLLVEDNDAVRLLGTRALTRSGYRVLDAADGEQGLEVAAAYPDAIDLMVTDVVMPRMGGRELARRLAETRPETRVIFTSGFTEDSVLRPETFGPGTHFLPKPFGPMELVGRVVEVLSEA